MKVKCLVRNPDDYMRETKKDIFKMPRNYDPDLHPFAAPREYTRAMNAAKLGRMLAKPFVGSLDGHRDSVTCLSKHPSRLSQLYTGAADGEVRIWDLARMRCLRTVQAHEGYIRAMTHTNDGAAFLTVGDDKTVKRWRSGELEYGEEDEPENTILLRTIVTSISHAVGRAEFATCGETCHIWDESRNEPVKTFSWGVDSLSCVRYNPVETHVLGACASDRSVILYDTREQQPIRRVTTQLRSNVIAWNPMEAFVFTAANEDYNLYSWDMRRLQRPLLIHKDHVSAVIDVDYSPTGREFVSGGYDKTLRIFGAREPRSRDIYHTRRMQRITCVCWTGDDKYVLSGSDEMNIRLWKARASEKLGVVKERERAARQYNERLVEKFASHPQVSRIARHRQVPRQVLTGKKEQRAIHQSQKRKEANRRAHSRPGTVPRVAEKDKFVLKEEE
ncbi:DDB1- and CUL4-associated factor 13-like [Amphibalanus amphitrite]|uniref:DDB1- and CUL4-associated factor 13-like n=1 Tax=Amphibalanus amphitrite TaxID=1232801 RepID=UPI001C90F034|nr:DDB1- and CUL4-associated factor 13-like [Amphibalanus amphitrite]XP_043208787.1 DDB1- and CUL4-associated factor 13-like [Amphibalanus amphitrite]XP_043208788.1 DDB1- and CUL4-associated factor 13-like [Amphibalanus amphitrite]XP_043208789.1 DDB1- and CUL4-associated factor 13-like [Amphibalanus amphitrite]